MIGPGPFSLKDKVVLITGASSGLGRASAQVAAKLGAKIIAAARNEVELQKTLESLPGAGHKMAVLDIASAESRNSVADQCEPLDGLVHCAGVAELVPFRMINEKHLRKIMNTNFEGPVLFTQRLLFKKKIKAKGSIIGITSTAGHVGLEASAIYSGTKGAMHSAFVSLGGELAKQQIRVNCIAPGYIQTNMLAQMNFTIDSSRVEGLAPLGPGRPEDVGHAVAFLLSDASRWVTRASLRVDGGILSNTLIP